ncbi:MAG: MBL fold metallo-hydrolase [Chloroflexi bacterium]|nr:MBL fold metallo-hydrolase [Chloroflexota bacterium]
MEIAPGIHQLRIPIPDNPLGYLNSYLVQGTKGWLMVDTGWFTSSAFGHLQGKLRTLGLSLADIATIVITHVHPDHFGLAGRIRQASPKTELLMHRYESDLIDSRYMKFADLQEKMAVLMQRHGVPDTELPVFKTASMPALEFVTVTLPDRVLYGGEVISTGVYDLEVIWTPGHAPGHICLYEPQNKLLFSGDHILPVISPNISYHVQAGDNPLGDFIGALVKLKHLPVAKVLPGHEHIFTDLPKRIQEILVHHDRRKAEIEQVILREPQTAYQISSQITWDLPGLTWHQFQPLDKRAAVMETLAHLEAMRWEGRVARIARDNLVFYTTA